MTHDIESISRLYWSHDDCRSMSQICTLAELYEDYNNTREGLLIFDRVYGVAVDETTFRE